MSKESVPPWGQRSFDRDRNWYARLPWRSGWQDNLKERYGQLRERALDDPTFDLFEHFMPTGKPKYDIGRYVMRHAVNVPLAGSMGQWQELMQTGRAMLRSEHPQDYTGRSGLLSSMVIGLDETYPLHEYHPGHYGPDIPWNDRPREVHGPVVATPTIRRQLYYDYRDSEPHFGDSMDRLYVQGLLNGTVNPKHILDATEWRRDKEMDAEYASKWHYRAMDHYTHMSNDASRWRYVPGRNLKVMRDPVIEGRYYVGRTNSHHDIWLLEDGEDSGDMHAYHSKRDHFDAYHGGRNPNARYGPSYVLPTRDIIRLYEKVRTLPFFDNRQAPLMELQHGDDGRLYFLQYLKTDRILGDPGEFTLPAGDGVGVSNDVSGATSPDGELVRIYLDPHVFTRSMENQAFFMRRNLENGPQVQVAAMMSRVCIQDYFLSFKDNHFSSAPLVRPPVAIGFGDKGNLGEKFYQIVGGTFSDAVIPQRGNTVLYINAQVTSNGRSAAVDSDWQIREEAVN